MPKQFVKLLPLLALLTVAVGCASMTPRYPMFNDQSVPDPNQAALLQIATSTQLLAFDDQIPTFKVRLPFASQGVVQHYYRETLIAPGLHYMVFQHGLRSQVKRSTLVQQVMQRNPFMAAFEAKAGHTYRVQTVGFVQGKYFYGWIDSIPIMMAPHKIKPSLKFNQQFQYWFDQDWRVVAAGVTLDDNGRSLCQETYGDAKTSILKEMSGKPEVPARQTTWPTMEAILAASRDGMEELKAIFPKLK